MAYTSLRRKDPAFTALAALALEGALGYPPALPHPVMGIGAAIAWAERRLNQGGLSDGRRRSHGLLTLILLVGASGLAGVAVQARLRRSPWPVLGLAAAASVGLAQRSLYSHVAPIADALEAGDLAQARAAVARIVGRDVDRLDASGVAAAALESLAESFNDGVVAPALWLLLGGLPGLYVYKAVNTADSMIGHREPPWRAFGWASARIDDLMNLLPARIAGSLVATSGGGGWRVMLRDAGLHVSPNAGWPEAAMAGALKVRLGGPASDDGVETLRPSLGSEGAVPSAYDLRRGLRLYVRACALLWGLAAGGGFAWRRR